MSIETMAFLALGVLFGVAFIAVVIAGIKEDKILCPKCEHRVNDHSPFHECYITTSWYERGQDGYDHRVSKKCRCNLSRNEARHNARLRAA